MGDKVFIRVISYHDVIRFGWKGKLAPGFVKPFEILECIGKVVY